MRPIGRGEAPEVPLFVVERFLPGMTPEGLEALAREQQGLDGVSYRHSTYVPADETCFCLIEAGSAQAVKEANAGARLPFERVVEAVHVTSQQEQRRWESLEVTSRTDAKGAG